jgi:aerobic-type carbon monoxide dehydrogenase small subunit (CoxS/CutS family)|nr:MAG: (2Fe-2S)-binding protein [Pseudomonadota bacterium]
MAEARWTLRINGRSETVTAEADTPLLYVLQNDLGLRGPRFGCGLGQCGSCSVLLDEREVRACITPVSAVGDARITTLEGLPAWQAARGASRTGLHPVQQALIDEQAPQCGYCMNGIVIKAAELLAHNPRPTEAQVREALDGHLCRCGAYPSILRAVMRASGQ